MTKVNILTEPTTVDNYPYGRLKCEMTFMVEQKPGKGYRAVTQSVNPKNGRVNAPKNGVYSHFIYMYKNETNGYIEFGHFNFRGYEDVEKFMKFLSENDCTFTSEESQNLWAIIISCVKANLKFSYGYGNFKEGLTVEEIFTAAKMQAMIEAYGKHKPLKELVKIGFSAEAIEALKK